MPIKIRPNPPIPDHEVLRKIGGGAYGEVWLARGVTGALRAVKVVWREDFEDARGFEREFEGILKFEPISRDHPALVNILHVGRSPDGVEFYYYVMELGDDVTSGQDINPIEYEPRTLRADSQQEGGVQWDTSDCIDVGLRLAEALGHLHEKDLAHRDVKPSNVIFVNGRAKLADIGLVAARGQRTFVGTEGFVPPEGPGSAQADIYSLGKVLYEIATGNDRMSFPELPEVIPSGLDRKRWLELNQIVCDICEPRVSKRRITTAVALAEALRRLQRGKRRRQSGFAVWMTTLVLSGFVAWVTWEMVKNSDWLRAWQPAAAQVVKQEGILRVVSAPEGAEVWANGILVGMTNGYTRSVSVGDDYAFIIKKTGFLPYSIQGKIPAAVVSEPFVCVAELRNFSPPKPGVPWSDHLGNSYLPVENGHLSEGFITKSAWQPFAESAKLPADAAEYLEVPQNGQQVPVVLVSEAQAVAFCDWLHRGSSLAGFLTADHELLPLRKSPPETPALSERARRDDLKPFQVQVQLIDYGGIDLITDPPGVEVYINPVGNPEVRGTVGITTDSLPIRKLKPGVWQLYLVREGYKPITLEVPVSPGPLASKTVKLEKSEGVIFGKPWERENHLKFIPLGPDLMVSIWETRVMDYDRFVKETKRLPPRAPDFKQEPNHPVVNVSRKDAQEFCEWLTQRERAEEYIAETHLYRLPTDLEWSLMAGLKEEPGISPSVRDTHKSRFYPWGVALPSKNVVGNFANFSKSLIPGGFTAKTIFDYEDGYAYTAPVGSFAPNALGIFDLSGNVQEWVEDDYSKLGQGTLGVLRGGGWNTYQSDNLLTGWRNPVPVTYQDDMYGFRVVLAKVPVKSD
jgi:eukaryotic-like serine/threonine-protein kinase